MLLIFQSQHIFLTEDNAFNKVSKLNVSKVITFPPVLIHANESTVKQHPSYRAAKSGDPDAAYLLVEALLNPIIVKQLADTFALQKPILVSAHAVEGAGVNAIPEALADMLAQQVGWPTDNGIGCGDI